MGPFIRPCYYHNNIYLFSFLDIAPNWMPYADAAGYECAGKPVLRTKQISLTSPCVYHGEKKTME